MSIPADLKYTREHEWLRLEGEASTFGITDHAQEALGDIVYVELPQVGTKVEAGKPCAVVESVKAVSDVYAPAPGEIIAANAELEAAPEKVNQDPYGEGWLGRIKLAADADLSALMDAAAYRAFLEE